MSKVLTAFAALAASSTATRQVYLLNHIWRYQQEGGGPAPTCANPNATFPVSYNNQQCLSLNQVSAASLNDCINACCADSSCNIWQYCNAATCAGGGSQGQCWVGPNNGGCQAGQGWLSKGRGSGPTPPPSPTPGFCTDPRCLPATDDSTWRSLDLPHDFVVEGNFTSSADKSHGYLPYGMGWYRHHMTIPTPASPSAVMYLDLEGVQTASSVWINGFLVGTHASGYTQSRYFLNASTLNFGGKDNVLAVKADATAPDGWWYDGGGIYRNVWLTVVDSTPGPYIAPWGVYAPSAVTGTITWGPDGAPVADSTLTPSVEVWSNITSTSTPFSFTVNAFVYGPDGSLVGSTTGSGSVPAYGNATWTATPIALPGASLWHLVSAPAKPALYRLLTVLCVGGNAVDSVNVTFGIRQTRWDGATGFWLNGVNTKIMGTANHQDFAGVGVAVPDHLQWYRVSKLKEMGVNGWRTAHNPPTPALLDAADELGMVVWDENHRNGQDDQVPLLIRRDRNHPSVVIWSLCNEVLCNTNSWVNDALRLKALMHSLDPASGRPVSANQNGWIGPNTPLDVQGFDYATGSYDGWHAAAPNIPSISSETSSAVSDRSEYFNDEAGGHVQGYDNQFPGWGQSAEGAWGGVAEPAGQGILTRPFLSGGWTWTGWDYKGEPTPYAWPDINSHFGILDIAGFPKDRFYWYRAWFVQPSPTPELYIFPHWNWQEANVSAMDVWVYSNADSVELFVNGDTQGRQNMQQYGHIAWPGVKYIPGTLEAVAYMNGSSVPVATSTVMTTGAASALRISVKDGVGASLLAGCADVALIQVDVIDSAGAVVPTANTLVTFSVTGPATFAGSGNGDPACHTPDKSPTRPAYHGLVMAVVQGGDLTGQVTVTASAPGFQPVQVTIQQDNPPAGFDAPWCHLQPRL